MSSYLCSVIRAYGDFTLTEVVQAYKLNVANHVFIFKVMRPSVIMTCVTAALVLGATANNSQGMRTDR